VGVLWAYEGWQYVTFSAGETVDPQRTFPRGIGVGSVLLVGVYLLANLGYVAALGVPGVMGSERVAAEAMASQFGVGSSRLIAVVILVAMFSASNGLILTTSRLYFAMARDGLFFARLAELHPRRGTPAVAVTAMSVWAALLALSGTFEVLLTYVVFAGWIFYGLGAASLLVLRRREGAPAGFRVPGYPVTTVAFVAASAGIVGNALVSAPVQGLIGSLMVLSGVPAYWWWRRRGGTGG
jgi:APA family basic amino acid/polyamine antiporter